MIAQLRAELAERQDETVCLLSENEAMRALLLKNKVAHQQEQMELCEQVASLQTASLSNEVSAACSGAVLSVWLFRGIVS